MNKNFKCVIFDLDGTLIDSGPDLASSLNYVLRKQGFEDIKPSILGDLVGGGAEMMIRRGFDYIKSKIDEKKVQIYISQFLEYYYNNCTNQTKLYKGVETTLKYLKKRNIKVCLCTNKKQYLTDKIIKEFELDNYFDFILGSSEKLEMKPSVQMLEFCSQKLQINSSEQCVMIGDSDNDIIPANRLNMTSIYVRYGYGELSKNLFASYEVNEIKEIIGICNF